MGIKVIKRDDYVVDFDLSRIASAIVKAFEAVDESYTASMIDLLSLRVTADFQSKISAGEIHLEDIQDSVEKVLSNAGYHSVARAYTLYRVNRNKLRNLCSTSLDFKETVDKYVKSTDWRVKENSTVTFSVGGLILHNSGAVTANYWLNEIYDKEVADAHKTGMIHLHDLSMLTSYCGGWSLRQLIQEGLGGVNGKITSAPATHLNTLCNQMVNFLGILQNEWAGAQAFASFDTYLAPFVKFDNLTYKEVKQAVQSFIFGVNTPSRWGTQSPFSNITLDWVCPKDLSTQPAIVGGKELDFKYGDCQKEMDMVNKAFLEVMIEGDAAGRGFQYPIPTYNITNSFNWESDNAQLLFTMTAKYGTPYFQNFINSDLDEGDVRSMCCFTGDEKVIYKDINNPESTQCNKMSDISGEVLIFNNNGWSVAKKIVLPNRKMFKVTLENDSSIIMSDNHINPTQDGDKITTELTYEDSLPILKKESEGFIGKCDESIIEYVKIVSIEEVEYDGELHSFEMKDQTNPYFVLANGLYTHNCRLQLDKRELRRRGGGLFGSDEFTGSVGVVTINLPRIAYISKDKDSFFKELDKTMEISKRSLEDKRKVIVKLNDEGLYPYTKRYLKHFNNHFSTIGLIGMNEMCMNANFVQKGLDTTEAQDFSIEVLNYMRNKMADYQEETGNLYNLEATPAESTSYRLAKMDKERYPDIKTAGDTTPYYTNSCHLPVDYTTDIFDAMDIQEKLQPLFTGGTVFHTYLGEKISDWEVCRDLVRKIANNYRIPYYTISPTYSICTEHGYISGEEYKCPICNKETEVYSRITGYYRPVKHWNDGKSEEFKNRTEYVIADDNPKNPPIECVIGKDSVAVTETVEMEYSQPLESEYKNKRIILFTSDTCINCPTAKALLKTHEIEYEEILATDNIDMANRFKVRTAPTLVVVKDNDDAQTYVGIPGIMTYLNFVAR